MTYEWEDIKDVYKEVLKTGDKFITRGKNGTILHWQVLGEGPEEENPRILIRSLDYLSIEN